MADITMCQNKECKLKDNCYRYQAVPSRFWQSYAEWDYKRDKSCYMLIGRLIDIKKKPRRKK